MSYVHAVLCLAALVSVCHAAPEAPVALWQVAQPDGRPAGAPRSSSVSMRFFSVRTEVPFERMAEAGRAFHITRADWSYLTDADHIRRIGEAGWHFQGTTNAITRIADHAIKGPDGTPVLDHFNQAGRFMADPKNPAYRDWYFEQLKTWMDLGVCTFQRDEPSGLGGLNGLRAWKPADADAFYTDMHKRVAAYAGERPVTWSCNLVWNGCRFGGRGEPFTKHFDYGMSEVNGKDVRAAYLWDVARDAARQKKALILTGSSDSSLATFRRAAAGCYANGMTFIVPWDQFGGIGKPRIFAKPEDLADLYGFVRGIAPYLEGHADAAAVGYGLKDARWAAAPLTIAGGSGRLTAFVRAVPADAAAPVVVHLVEWADRGAPATVTLDTRAFTGGKPLSVTMLTPTPYDRAAHDLAETEAEKLRAPGDHRGPAQAPAYAPLVKTTPLTVTVDGDWAAVNVPALSPWGVLVVRAAE